MSSGGVLAAVVVPPARQPDREPTLRDLRQRLRHATDFTVLYLLYRLAGCLPWRVLGPWGRAVGRLAWHLVPVRKQVVLDNLSHAFGAELDAAAIRALARRFYETLGATLLEFCSFRRLDDADVLRLTRIEGEEHLAALRTAGQGALLVSGHFGNWELLGAALAARGYKVHFLAKTQSNRHVDRLQNELREHAGIGIIRVGPSLKEMIRALRRGELVGLLGDQDAGPLGLFVDFLGRPASVFRGPAIYAHRFRCPLITGFIFRQPDGSHVIKANPPLIPEPDWDEETTIAQLTAAHTRHLESAVRAAPENYFWVHRRWKTRPSRTSEERPTTGPD